MRRQPWTIGDPRWQALGDHERVAVMSLMEADRGKDYVDNATNVMHAIHNRASVEGVPLGRHVSGRVYQPTIEPGQQHRLGQILRSPEYQRMLQTSRDRASGTATDTTGGATHFLAHEPVMERLRNANPNMYRSWPGWTGYRDGGGRYQNVHMRDASHAFLTPKGGRAAPVSGDAEAQPGGFYGETRAPSSALLSRRDNAVPIGRSRGDVETIGAPFQTETRLPQALPDLTPTPEAMGFAGGSDASSTYLSPAGATGGHGVTLQPQPPASEPPADSSGLLASLSTPDAKTGASPFDMFSAALGKGLAGKGDDDRGVADAMKGSQTAFQGQAQEQARKLATLTALVGPLGSRPRRTRNRSPFEEIA